MEVVERFRQISKEQRIEKKIEITDIFPNRYTNFTINLLPLSLSISSIARLISRKEEQRVITVKLLTQVILLLRDKNRI